MSFVPLKSNLRIPIIRTTSVLSGIGILPKSSKITVFKIRHENPDDSRFQRSLVSQNAGYGVQASWRIFPGAPVSLTTLFWMSEPKEYAFTTSDSCFWIRYLGAELFFVRIEYSVHVYASKRYCVCDLIATSDLQMREGVNIQNSLWHFSLKSQKLETEVQIHLCKAVCIC